VSVGRELADLRPSEGLRFLSERIERLSGRIGFSQMIFLNRRRSPRLPTAASLVCRA